MTAFIPARELRSNHTQVLTRVREGERITVLSDGRPIVDLVPHTPDVLPPMFRSADEQRTWPAMAPAAREAWLADIRALDSVCAEFGTQPGDRA